MPHEYAHEQYRQEALQFVWTLRKIAAILGAPEPNKEQTQEIMSYLHVYGPLTPPH